MGNRTIEKKRKAAPSTASPSSKKTKKDEVKSRKPAAAETKSPKATKAAKPTVLPAVETGKKEKAPRKRAADFMNEEEEEAAGWAGFEEKENEKAGKKGTNKAKKTKGESAVQKKSRKDDPLRLPTAEEEIRLAAEDSEDDQASTLLKGFESSDEESDAEGPSEKGRGDMSKQGLPDSEKTKKKLKEAKKSNEPGVILISRIPHGFYEHEMKSYFTQFGDVLRIRLSRNKKTGRSKHYAFLEFANAEVANIVAETMDNYLLYGHILKCKAIPRSQIEDVDRLFKGANRRFKKVPWNDVARRGYERKRTSEEWGKIEEREEKRRKVRNAKLAVAGIEYEFEAKVRVAEPAAEKETEKPAEEEPVVEKAKGKKGKAKKVIEDTPAVPAVKVKNAVPAEEPVAAPKKASKAKKAKK